MRIWDQGPQVPAPYNIHLRKNVYSETEVECAYNNDERFIYQ